MKINLKKIIEHIKKIKFTISKKLDYDSFKNLNDLFYTLNSQIFENSKLNHTERLDYLDQLRKIIVKNKIRTWNLLASKFIDLEDSRQATIRNGSIAIE